MSMHNSRPNPNIQQHNFTFVHKGVQLYVSVSPCAWMHQWYPMQIKISVGEKETCNAASKFLSWKQFYEDCSDADIRVQVNNWLTEGDNFEKFVANHNEWEERDRAYQAGAEERRQKAAMEKAAQDTTYKAKGFTHRVNAWVHPSSGGDDYPIEMYCKGEPTKAQIRKELNKRGSAVMDDYQITVL